MNFLSALPGMGSAQEAPKVMPGEGVCLSAELIYPLEGRPTPQCHASTIVELPGGEFAAAWFGGANESNPNVGIWFSRWSKGQWSAPVQVATGAEGEDRDYACWNPVLFRPKEGPLLLFYKAGLNPRLWWGALLTSADDGKTWSPSRRLGTSDSLPQENRNLLGPVKNKPVQLANGAILCPSSTENQGWRVHFEITRDLGKTWEVIGPINDGVKFNAIQPSILTHRDGRLQILCRSREKTVVQSWSKDGGKTWSEITPTKLPNPNSGTDALTLSDGRQLIVYNPLEKGRHILAVALSDDGENWKQVLTLEKEERGEFSYPAVIQAADGRAHITYTWMRQSVKHVVLDAAKL